MAEIDFEKQYQRLNLEQKQVVDTLDGPVMVVAGAGTGKTQVLSLRVANILIQSDTPPKSILCLTFTDAAAKNMRDRLRKMIGITAQKISIHTFHSLGTEIINQNPEYFFQGADFEVADDLKRVAILEEILNSLKYDSPLKSRLPDGQWTYLKDIQARIRDLKQEGLTPEEYRKLLEIDRSCIDLLEPIFKDTFNLDTIKKLTQDSFQAFFEKSEQIYNSFIERFNPAQITLIFQDKSGDSGDLFNQNSNQNLIYPQNYLPWIVKYYNDILELKNILNHLPKWSTTPIKLWRDSWGKKDDLNQFHLRDFLDHDKYLALADIYAQYQDKMQLQRLFDYDDMLLQVVEAFRKNPSLRYSYQEKYLYVLVDEFQDTNGVQMNIIDSLLNLEVAEGRPNICVVGDDDQAIYKFQKATIANIRNFREKYRDVKIITLKQNYRSSQDILDMAMQVIQQSSTRLADWEEVDKVLRAVNS